MKDRNTHTLKELTEAGFGEIKHTFPTAMFKTEGDRTMIYVYVGEMEGELVFRRGYDGETRFVQGLLNRGDGL